MVGGTVSSPGTLRRAVACVRVDAIHLRLMLDSPLSNTSASCRLFYPYGSYSPADLPAYTGDMGRGNAVTDNFAVLAKPAGWDRGRSGQRVEPEFSAGGDTRGHRAQRRAGGNA